MKFGLSGNRVRAHPRAHDFVAPRLGTGRLPPSGARRLAVVASAAGVLVVSLGIALAAVGGASTIGGSPKTKVNDTNGDRGHATLYSATIRARSLMANSEAAYPPAYPPRTPCSLRLIASAAMTGGATDTSSGTTSADPTSTEPTSMGSTSTGPAEGVASATVQGSGLGSAQMVTVAYYAHYGSTAAPLGSWRTTDSGSFEGSVRIPNSGGDAAFVLARSTSAQCSAPAGSSTPGYPPSTGTTGPGVSSTPTAPSGVSGPTSGSAGPSQGDSSPSGPPPGGDGNSPRGSGSNTATATGNATPSGNSSGGTISSGSPTSGAVTPPTTSPTAAPRTTPTSIGAQNWGLPTSFIVTMALILLVLGGLAVLVLTRRSG